MKFLQITSLFLVVSQLAGCDSAPDDSGSSGLRNGRYVGIGVFNSGVLWSQMRVAKPLEDISTARIADDEHIIVVVDTKTGQVRECGDYSGYCITMNPWTKAVDPSMELPVSLIRHASDIDAKHDDNAAARAH